MPRFGIIHSDGSITDERDISQDDIRRCPFYIMIPEHYREDGSCRCNDPDHSEMITWGYVWDVPTQRWVAPLENDDA